MKTKMIEKLNIKKAFTLAEVLITLGIIGIIAAVTIPSLIQNEREKSTVTALRKNYSDFTNAIRLAINENGSTNYWDFINGNPDYNSKVAMDILLKYLNISKYCGNGVGCFPAQKYLNLNKTEALNYNAVAAFAKAQLASGASVLIYRDNRTRMTIMIDVNGFKGPNQLGVDTFHMDFYNDKNALIPYGLQSDATSPFDTTCRDKTASTATGKGCAAWVIYSENMDYLHCSNLSWNGKRTCD